MPGAMDGAVGGITSGVVSGLASVYGSILADRQAREANKLARKKHDSDTRLDINQFNINQNRLKGLASAWSGTRDRFRNEYNINEEGISANERRLRENAADTASRATFNDNGDYAQLNVSDYTIDGNTGGTGFVGNGYNNVLGLNPEGQPLTVPSATGTATTTAADSTGITPAVPATPTSTPTNATGGMTLENFDMAAFAAGTSGDTSMPAQSAQRVQTTKQTPTL